MGRDFENRKAAIFKTAAQKSKVYSKYGKQVYVLAKNGVPDPDGNPALRSLIEKAKRDQVPGHVIDKALEKARGVGGEDFTTLRYEGFGPGGCLVIVDCLTDNNNRTITDVRNCFTKTGSKMGAAGSVIRSFDHLAVIAFKWESEDQVLETLLEADVAVEEIERKSDGTVAVFTPAQRILQGEERHSESVSQRRIRSSRNHISSADEKTTGPRRRADVREVPEHAERVRGRHRVTSTNDPTAHAEVVAIRDACARLQTFSLAGCEIYSSCEPCPLCLAAIYWARLNRIHFAATCDDAAAAGFDDRQFYLEMHKPAAERSIPIEQSLRAEAKVALQAWVEKQDRIRY